MLNFDALAQQCAPSVHPTTMAAVIQVESTFNAFAIGVVGARLERQPTNLAEAVATARALEAAGYNFSLGIAQVNRHNLSKYGLDYQAAFAPCANLGAASLILKDCYDRAKVKGLTDDSALQAALSCYYSGNFSAGFRPDSKGQQSYVQRVLNSAAAKDDVPRAQPIRVAPLTNAKTVAGTPSTGAVQVTAEAASSDTAVPSRSDAESDAVMVYR
jgi:type IV secretion system protein VirB1